MLRSVLGRLFGLGGSKQLAKNRLQFVLVQDRAGLTNEELTQFKKELVEVIQRYFVIADKGFDISYRRGGDSTTLLINSPIIVKRDTAALSRGGSRNGSRAHAAKMATDKGAVADKGAGSGAAKPASLQGELFEQGLASGSPAKGAKPDAKESKSQDVSGSSASVSTANSAQSPSGQKLADKVEVAKSEPTGAAKGAVAVNSGKMQQSGAGEPKV